jgi:hypothetical protein
MQAGHVLSWMAAEPAFALLSHLTCIPCNLNGVGGVLLLLPGRLKDGCGALQVRSLQTNVRQLECKADRSNAALSQYQQEVDDLKVKKE